MGVHGLWELLAPVGRRVSVETLAGKRLAIDASIWMIQFMKAMRDDNGEMVRNAHILGFFRRICKLLYLRTKPVFVFDGGTPALKRRTVIARRRHRENAQAKIRKTAEKLLLNQFKQIKLKELADELERQKMNKNVKGKKAITGEEEVENLSKSSDVDNKEVITDTSKTTAGESLTYSDRYNQEELDEMLAASLLTEEEGLIAGESSLGPHVHDQEEEDVSEDEEMILPPMHTKVDPSVLASLPPSMQLDLLVQMRERLMAENRQKYQKVKKVPSSFSELQIESYLKTVAFRREINEVRKSASGRGIGGVQTSRIASEANREFIFSSSYSGDKEVLTSAGRGSGNNDHSIVDNGALGKGKSVSESNDVESQLEAFRKGKKVALVSNEVEPPLPYENDVETYLDERGRVRVSRVRAMGIRMTRDLQRNLDLMKEVEEERVLSTSNPSIDDPSASGIIDDSVLDTDELVASEEAQLARTSLEISFENNGQDEFGGAAADDDLFASLVAGDPVMGFSVENSCSKKEDLDNNASELEWEDGDVMDEKEVEWEEEESLDVIQRDSSYIADFKEKTVSKGSMIEEADFQEAIRRSLDDVNVQKFENVQRASESAQFLEDRFRSDSEDVESPGKVQGTVNAPHNLPEIQSAPPSGGGFGGTEFESERSSDAETPMKNTSCRKDDSFASSSNASLNTDLVSDVAVMATTSVRNAINEVGFGKEPASEGFSIHSSTEKEDPFKNLEYFEEKEDQSEVLNARMEEEMLMLGQEQLDLGNEQKKLERNAESVSSEMFAEAQELLQMFGLPYIIAPMEAEAQCAYLELVGLVDGVVTDDSDAFLFGARSVYKNIFDNRKYVETYFMKDIENELGINREKLIRMALLLGSDYTEGISGIGIVNAIEVVNAFPEEDGLCKFREWIESPDPSILGKFEKQAGSELWKRTSSKIGDDEVEVGASSSDESQRVKKTFMDKHRNVSKNWHVSPSFPSDAVISAYASPQVDKAKEPFSWGKPDLLVLRKLCWEKFGWSGQKANELLLPVLKEYDKRETQLRMEAFYTFNERFAKIRSKRIKTALKGIAGTKSLPLIDESKEDGGESNKGKRRKIQDADNTETLKENKLKRKGLLGRSQIRGRGMGMGRGRGRGRGTKESESSDEDGISSGDGSGAKSGQELQHQVRRSKRARKEVKYSMDEPKDDDIDSDQETNHSSDDHNLIKDAFGDWPLTQDLNITPLQTENPETPKKDSTLCIIDASVSEGTKDFNFDSDNHQSCDYLNMGGGFCFDDDEEEKKVVKDPIEDTFSLDLEMTFDPTHGVCSSFFEDDEIDTITHKSDESNACDDTKGSSEKSRNESEGVLGDESVMSFRALPNLRKKRKVKS